MPGITKETNYIKYSYPNAENKFCGAVSDTFLD